MNPEPKKEIRVRFAPSPTGPFSIGNARTALFNWLYVCHNDGKFLLRIEDTDKKRSREEYKEQILESLKWLGIEWSEKIEYQSKRLDIYKKYLKKLLAEDKIFYCFCSEEELEADRQAKLSQGLPPGYSGRCRNLSESEVKRRINKGDNWVLRFKMPNIEIEFQDLIRSKVSFKGELIGDFVVAKDFESPLYNFAVVVDDYDMKVTHVIRGEDHISNTPRQIALQEALGFEKPKYAHLPLILEPGGKKLSKRYLKKSFLDYKAEGYVPEAMINFITLLGWHPEKDREVITIEEAIEEFTLSRVQKSGAVLNENKLDWYNSYYIRNMPIKKLINYLKDFIPKDWIKNEAFLEKVVEVERERMRNLADFKNLADFFFKLPEYQADLLIWKDKREVSVESLKRVLKFLESLSEEEFVREKIEPFFLKLAEENGGKGEVFWPFRVALSGKKASPGGLEILSVLGKWESLERIRKAIEKAEGLKMLD